jgi:hypothetical protein
MTWHWEKSYMGFEILAALKFLDCMALEQSITGLETMELVMRWFFRGALGSMGNGKAGRLQSTTRLETAMDYDILLVEHLAGKC